MRSAKEIHAAMELLRANAKACGLIIVGERCHECYATETAARALEWALGGEKDFDDVVQRLAKEAMKCP